MTSLHPQPGVPRHRRPKAVLAMRTAFDTATQSAVDLLCAESGASLIEVRTADDLSFALERSERFIRLLIADSEVEDFLSLARAVAEQIPDAELVVLTATRSAEELTRMLGPAARLGKHWRAIGTGNHEALLKSLRTAFVRGDQRASTRTTLDRFNARLTAPAAGVDATDMRALTISERFLFSVLDSSYDAVILLDPAGRITTFNRAAESLFERKADSVISLHVNELSLGEWSETLNKALNVKSEGATFNSELVIGEQVKQIEITASPVFDRENRAIATSMIIRDTTARLHAEQIMRTNEKLAVVGRLASSIAHEINNPLEAVTNLLYIARQNAADEEQRHWLDLADQELRRVSIITNQTLRFHKQSTAPTKTNTVEMITGVLSIFQGKLANSNITVVQQFKAKGSVTCLEGEIRQVLTNLIGNAIDAMPNGGTLTVRTQDYRHRRDERSGMLIVVSDNGTGMSRKTLTHLFDAFFSTKGANGTGLGLWISQEIVERHNGSLKVRSWQDARHRGTAFRLFLPFDFQSPERAE